MNENEMYNLKVKDMPFSDNVKALLVNYTKVDNLIDLLMMDYNELRSIRGFDRYDLEIIKAYVHGMGYQFYNEQELDDKYNEDINSISLKLKVMAVSNEKGYVRKRTPMIRKRIEFK